jgi:ferredoxin
LPPLLSISPWAVLAVMAVVIGFVALVPRLFGTGRWGRDTPVVVIDEAACTGCDLCVVDCPYEALSLVESATSRRGSIAVVDAAACVGCGICVGSCSFGAMELPGFESPATIDPRGHRVVIACQRHVRQSGALVAELAGADADDPTAPRIVEVSCTGMVHPQAIGSLMNAGATGVQIVGCPPGDCAYGIGNQLADQRLHAERAPRIQRRFADVAVEDYVNPLDLRSALEHPGSHPSVDPASLSGSRRGAVAALALVLASILFVSISTWAPFSAGEDQAMVRVVVDHQPGLRLVGQSGPTGVLGASVTVDVVVDGRSRGRHQLVRSGDSVVGTVDVEVTPGDHRIEVTLDEGGSEPTVVFDADATIDKGRRLEIGVVDEPPPPGAAEGKKVFDDSSKGGCGICHSVKPGDDGIGPSLAGVGTRAADRIPGLDAEAYLRQSILDPDAFIVPGYRAGQMNGFYRERLSAEDLDALIVYLLSLTGQSSGGGG